MSTPTHDDGTTPNTSDNSHQQDAGMPGQHDAEQPYGQASYGQQSQPYGQPSYETQNAQAPYGNQAYGQGQNYGQQQYGQGQTYGQPQYGQSYGQQQYGAPQYGQGQYAPMPPTGVPFASYGSRVGAHLIDGLLSFLPVLLFGILGLWMAFKDSHEVPAGTFSDGTLTSTSSDTTLEGVHGSGFALAGLGFLITLLFGLWNQGIRQGKTGQSLGKKMLHLKVVDERTGLPTGAGTGVGRYLLEAAAGAISSGFLTLIDLLWPLWDEKKQTLHDKIVHTVVVKGD